MSSTGEHTHRGYIIRTMVVDRKVKARAFTGRKAVLDAEAGSVEGALKTLREKLDARDAARRTQRRDDVPTAEEFVDALNRVDAAATDAQRRMLRALYDAPGRTLTSTQVAVIAGYTRHMTVNEKFGKYARLIAEDLGYEPATRSDGTPIWTSTIASEAEPDSGAAAADWRWTLRPEVAEAIARLGWFTTPPVARPH
jgi:hypothetical protein